MNNFERIKNMDINEMAKLLNWANDCGTICAKDVCIPCDETSCIEEIKKWLLMEARNY